MDQLGIDKLKVRQCLDDSFIKDKKDNKILKEDKNWAKKLGIILHPSITINNLTYRGDITGLDVFRAICAGFAH